MAIPFRQYLLPDGRQKQIEIDRPEEVETKAQAIIAAGCRLEAEVLMTGEVSFTVFDLETETDEACEVCANGPAVLDAVDRLIMEFELPATSEDSREDRAFDALIVAAARGIDPEAIKKRMDELDSAGG